MKISGFTIIRNAIINDYPVVESILSILPLVDEMVVSVGNSEDGTLDLIASIPSNKIKIFESVWDPGLRRGGEILAVETNKAFANISPDSDWAFYLQADEVVHEKYHEEIRQVAEKYKADSRVQGLLFNYLHFYGTYDYVGDSRKWYHKEVRIIRTDQKIQSYLDAQGFRVGSEKIRVKPVNAYIYHYGWVKNPRRMKEKEKNVHEYWEESDSEAIRNKKFRDEIFNYNDFDSLRLFNGTHPHVMEKRIADKNWEISLDISKKQFSLKEKLLYWYEKKTGKRLFDFKNYKVI